MSEDEKKPSRLRRILRTSLRISRRILLGVAVAVLAVGILLQIPFVSSFVAHTALSLANPWRGTTASVGSAGGSWFRSLSLTNVRIIGPSDSLFISIDSLYAEYDLGALLGNALHFRQISLSRPTVRTRFLSDGTARFLEPFAPDTNDHDTTAGIQIRGDRLEVRDGELELLSRHDSTLRQVGIQDINLSADSILIGGGVAAVVEVIDARLVPNDRPEDEIRIRAAGAVSKSLARLDSLRIVSANSRIKAEGSVPLPFGLPGLLSQGNLNLRASPVSYKDIHLFLPDVGPNGEANIDFQGGAIRESFSGRLTADFPSGGSLAIQAKASMLSSDSLALEIRGTSGRFSPASLTGNPDPSESIQANFSLEGRGRSLRDFDGLASLEVSRSYFSGLGPVAARVKGTIRQASIRADVRAEQGPVTIKAQATLRPFESASRYHALGSVAIGRGEEADGFLRQLDGLQADFSLSAIGTPDGESQADALLRGEWIGNPNFKSLFVRGTYKGNTAHASVNVATVGGSLRAVGVATLGTLPEYTIQSADFRNISLASFGDGLPTSSLTGSLSGKVKGASMEDLTGNAALALDSSVIGDAHLDRVRAEYGIDQGQVHFTGNVVSDVGSASLRGSARLSPPAVVLERVDFKDVELGKILGEGKMTSSLAGTMELRAKARSMRDISRMAKNSLSVGERAVQVDARLLLRESQFNREIIRSGAIAVGLLDGQIRTNINVETARGGVTGEAEGRIFASVRQLSIPALTWNHLDIGALAGSGPRTNLSGTLKGSLEGDSIQNATGALSFGFVDSSIVPFFPSSGSLEVEMERGHFSLNTEAAFRDGGIAVEAAGRFIPGGVRGKVSLDAAFRDSTTLAGAAEAGPPPLLVRGVVEGVWGVPSETELTARIHGGGSHLSFRADTLLCGFSVRGRVLDLDTLKVLTNIASATGGGVFALFDSTSNTPSSLSLSAKITSLQPLESILGLGSTLLHSASLSLRADGPPERTSVHCETGVETAALGSVALTSMQGSADLRLRSSAALESLDGELHVEGFHYGPISVPSGLLSVHSIGSKFDISSLLQLGRGSTFSLAGSIQDDGDSLIVLLDTLTARGPAQTWSLERQASITYGGRLVVRDLMLHSGSRDIVLKGILDPKGEQDFTVLSDSLSVENIGKLFGRPGLVGVVGANLHVSGPAANPRALGDISVSLSNEGADLGRLASRLDWTATSLKIDGGITQPNGGRLDVVAKLPLDFPLVYNPVDKVSAWKESSGGAVLDVLVEADGFNLEFFKPLLSPQTVNALSGMLAADLRVSGTRDSVLANGTVSVSDGRLGLTQLGTTYSGIRINCTASGKDLRIEDASMTSGEGILNMSGLLSLKNPARPAADLKMTLDKFVAIQTPDIKGNVTGDLQVTGSISAPDITGNLTVNDSYYVMPEGGKLDSVEVVELTMEDYAMLQRYFGYSRPIEVAEPEGEPSAFEPTMSVTVAMQKNTWFRKRRNPTLAIELQGTVRIERRPGQPTRLVGTLRCPAGRSYVGQFGRQFELTEGEILLKGPIDETELHINSEYKIPSKGGTGISEVVIRMKVDSNLGRFIFSLTSDPAMDESEILSYLATGQSRTGALANTGDQGGLAGAMALEQLVGAAGGLAEGTMPLDVFQIRQDGARGITVVAGNYVSPKTYLGVRQPILFNQGTEDTYYDTRTQYEFEYQAKSWLFLNLQGGSSRTLLLLKARVAY